MVKSLLSSQSSSSICTQASLLTELDNYCTSFPFPFSFSPHPTSPSSYLISPLSSSAIIFSFFLPPTPSPLTPPLITLSLAYFPSYILGAAGVLSPIEQATMKVISVIFQLYPVKWELAPFYTPFKLCYKD